MSNKNKKENLIDKLTLSQWDYYSKYDKFPFRFIIHTLLIVFTSIAVLNYSQNFNINLHSEIVSFKSFFLNIDENTYETQFLTLNDFQNHLNSLMKNIRKAKNLTFSYLDDQEAKYFINVYNLKNFRDLEPFRYKYY